MLAEVALDQRADDGGFGRGPRKSLRQRLVAKESDLAGKCVIGFASGPGKRQLVQRPMLVDGLDFAANKRDYVKCHAGLTVCGRLA